MVFCSPGYHSSSIVVFSEGILFGSIRAELHITIFTLDGHLWIIY